MRCKAPRLRSQGARSDLADLDAALAIVSALVRIPTFPAAAAAGVPAVCAVVRAAACVYDVERLAEALFILGRITARRRPTYSDARAVCEAVLLVLPDAEQAGPIRRADDSSGLDPGGCHPGQRWLCCISSGLACMVNVVTQSVTTSAAWLRLHCHVRAAARPRTPPLAVRQARVEFVHRTGTTNRSLHAAENQSLRAAE